MSSRVERVLGRLGLDARRQGREWVALCPNPGHEDKSPSWRIRDEPGARKDGLHHCWPCGFSGGMAGLVATVRGCSIRDALEWLADDLAPSDEPVAAEVELRVRTRRGFRLPDGVVVAPLEEWVTPARKYVEGRRIPAWQVERWGIGYAVGGKLDGRIVVPYRDGSGRPRGYTARTYVGHPKRYREPDPHEGADRGALFGEQHWDPRRDVPRGTSLYVTEGAINALAVERALRGELFLPSVAAIGGSRLYPAHAAKLAAFGRLVLITDPDSAGDKVADEIAGSLARHADVVRVRLPEGTDAAQLAEPDLRERLRA